MARQTMKPPAPLTKAMPTMAGEVMRRRKAMPRRGPILSQTMPMRKRQMMLVETAARLPLWMSERLRLRVVGFMSVG